MAAIKIPRDKSSDLVSLPTTRISSSAQDVVGPNIDRLTSFLERTAKEKHANNIRLETLRVNDKVAAKKSLLDGMGIEFIQNLKEMDEIPSPENMDKLMKQHKMKVEAEVNRWNQGDNNFKSAFEGEKLAVLNSTKEKFYQEKNIKILLQGRVRWDTYNTDRSKRLDGLVGQPSHALWAAYEYEKQYLEKEVSLAQGAGLIEHLKLVDEQNKLLLEFGKIAASAGFLKMVEKPDGTMSQEVDNLAVLKSLTDIGEPVFDEYEGEQISGKRTTYYGIDISPIRDKLIEHFDKASTDQINTEIKNDKVTVDNLTDLFMPSALDGTGNLDVIDNANWPLDPNSQDIKNQIKSVLIASKSGSLNTESNVNMTLEIETLIETNKIFDEFEKFWLPDEIDHKEAFMKLDGFDANGGSIATRLTLGMIGTTHNKELKKMLMLDDADRARLTRFNTWADSIKPKVEGKLSKHNLHAKDYWFQTKMMLRERFFDGLRKGIPIQELTNSTHPNFIFKDQADYYKTLQKQAEELAISMQGGIVIDTSGKISTRDYTGPVYNNEMKSKYTTKDDWLNSPEFLKWRFVDYPENTIESKAFGLYMQYDFTPPAIMATYSKQSKNLKISKATNQIEKDAIELDIVYHLVPPVPDGFLPKAKNRLGKWVTKYKEKNTEAITLNELEKKVKEEKSKYFKPKRKKRRNVTGTSLNTDNKTKIEKKILDNDPRFDQKDGIYYWKGTNIEVDVNQIE
jgi:hypothetical protein